jgi:adenine-specific DNA-methyltransferase
LERTIVQAGRFRNPDNDPRGPWRQGDDGTAKSGSEKQRFPITLPSGRVVRPKQGRYWAFSEETFNKAREEERVYFGKDGDRLPVIKRYAELVREGVAPRTWWTAEEAGTNQAAKRDHLSKLLPHIEAFATPKPEQLLRRILQINSNPQDLVLDSFLGSGTTAAVAHKMGRCWIGIEMGEHARTHCLPRLEKVVAGEQGGISKDVKWTGGGGFRFMKLGAPVFDEHGRIHPDVRFATLAAFVWQQETGTAFDASAVRPGTPYLGTHQVRDEAQAAHEAAPARPAFSLYLLFNGILGDRRPESGNVLTRDVLSALVALHARVAPAGTPLIVYGESVRVGAARLAAAGVTFRQIPYDIRSA